MRASEEGAGMAKGRGDRGGMGARERGDDGAPGATPSRRPRWGRVGSGTAAGANDGVTKKPRVQGKAPTPIR
jgi:hypothetical protein